MAERLLHEGSTPDNVEELLRQTIEPRLPYEGSEISIEHVKLSGQTYDLGKAFIEAYEEGSRIKYVREMRSNGTYDGLGVEKKAGDRATSHLLHELDILLRRQFHVRGDEMHVSPCFPVLPAVQHPFGEAYLSRFFQGLLARAGLQKSLGLLAWAISKTNIEVYPTAIGDYEGALPIARDNGVSANDALAYLLMRGNELEEIYSFDRHFDQLKDITRIPSK